MGAAHRSGWKENTIFMTRTEYSVAIHTVRSLHAYWVLRGRLRVSLSPHHRGDLPGLLSNLEKMRCRVEEGDSIQVLFSHSVAGKVIITP